MFRHERGVEAKTKLVDQDFLAWGRAAPTPPAIAIGNVVLYKLVNNTLEGEGGGEWWLLASYS